jgi:hypothetical protein
MVKGILNYSINNFIIYGIISIYKYLKYNLKYHAMNFIIKYIFNLNGCPLYNYEYIKSYIK